MSEGSLGEAVLDLTADPTDLKEQVAGAYETVKATFEKLEETVGKSTIAVVATFAALVVGAVASIKIGMDAVLAWSEQTKQLTETLGISAEDASSFAVAMNHVGVSVEEGAGGINIFVRNLAAMRVASEQAKDAYATAMADIAESNRQVLESLGEQWATQQQDIADKRITGAQDLADKLADIEATLGENIAKEKDTLTKRLAQMDYDRAKQTQDFAKQAAQLARDAARETTKVTADEAKNLAALEKDTQKKLKGAQTMEDRNAILAEAAERKKEIQDAANERRAEIAERKAERLMEMRDKQTQAQQEFARNKQMAQEESALRIAAMEKQAAKQVQLAEKTAQKQEAALDKLLAKQEAVYNKALDKQQVAVENSQRKAAAALQKAETVNPVAQGLKKLGIAALGADGQIRKIDELLPEIMDKFKAMPAGTEASAIAMQLFGRTGTKFMEFLRLGSEGLDTARGEAEAWGLSMQGEALEVAEEFGFALNDLKMAFNGIWVAIGKNALPVLRELVDHFGEFMTTHGPGMRQAIDNVFKAFAPFGVWLKTVLIPAIAQLGEWFKAHVLPVFAKMGQQIGREALPAIRQFATWLGNNLPTVFKLLGDVWDNVLKPVFVALGGVIAWLWKNAPMAGDALMKAWNQIQVSVAAAWIVIKPVFDKVVAALSKFWMEIQPQLAQAGNLIGQVWMHIQVGLSQAWSIIQPIIARLQETFAKFWTEIQPKLIAAWNTISTHAQKMWAILQMGLAVAWAAIQPIIVAIQKFLTEHGEEIKAVLTGVWNEIQGVVQFVWATISGVIKLALDLLGGDFTAFKTDLLEMWRGQWAAVGTILGGAWDIIQNMVSLAAQAVWQIITSKLIELKTDIEVIWNGVVMFFTNLPSTMLEHGKNILQGLIDGLWQNADHVRQALVDIITGGIDAVKTFLKISSPSQVFADMGKNMALGLAQGFAQPQLNFAPTLASSLNLARLPMTGTSSTSVDNRRSESMINIHHSDPEYIRRIVREEQERARWA